MPPHVKNAETHTHPAVQKFHVEKVFDIKDKMKDIAEVQTHIDDLLDRLGTARERIIVKETVGSALSRHDRLEREYLAKESERRIRAIMRGRPVAPQAYDVDAIVGGVAPARKEPVEKMKRRVKRRLAACKDAQCVRELVAEVPSLETEAPELAAQARTRELEIAVAVAPTPELQKELAAAKLHQVQVAAAEEAKAELALAKKSGDPDMIERAAERVEQAVAAVNPAPAMPETIVREIERVKWLAQEKAGAERKEEAKKAVEQLVEAAIEKRQAEQQRIQEVVEERKQMLQALHQRQEMAGQMKAKAAEMMEQAKAARLLAQAKLVEAKAEAKQLAELNGKLQEVGTALSAIKDSKREGILKLMDNPPEL